MKVHILKPYDLDKNLGRAYNEAMSMIPEGDWACLMDLDTMFLTPDAGTILTNYAEKYPETGLFTCLTNRIHSLAKQQLVFSEPSEVDSIRYWIKEAERVRESAYFVTTIHREISGFLMMVSKETWNKIKFDEIGKCLGVDNDFSLKVLASGRDIKRMDGLLVWHTYRLRDITNKKHLL
jgi:GT2 family glycosyltransferase